MAEQIIIAIGREFGSGGHEIAEKLSELYGIKLYDKNILQNIAEAKNVDVASYEKYDEVPKKMIFSRTVKGLSNSMEENIAQLQFRYLEDKANAGESFVVVGRCAETMLKYHRHWYHLRIERLGCEGRAYYEDLRAYQGRS